MRTALTHTPTGLLAVTLAIGALSVPAASARPIDLNSPVGDAATRTNGTADPPSADGRESALLSQRAQDLRHLQAGNGATANLSGSASAARAKAQGRYYASYGHPQTIRRVAFTDDGTPWLTIAGSLAGVCLVIGGSTAIAGRRSRGQAPNPRAAI